MTFKAFLFGLLGTFGVPWLFVVIIPFSKMRNPDPIEFEDGDVSTGVYLPKRDGRITEGSLVYGQEGCAKCHTQLIRPTYAGWDVHRDLWAGLRKGSGVEADTRRETIALDFQQEKIAHIGVSRIGPDLSNFGRRLEFYLKKSEVTPEEWVLMHLYNPKGVARYDNPDEKSYNSNCPPKGGLFKKEKIYGAGSGILPVATKDGEGIRPNDRANALVSYLLSLKKDTLENPLPESLNFNPEAPVTTK